MRWVNVVSLLLVVLAVAGCNSAEKQATCERARASSAVQAEWRAWSAQNDAQTDPMQKINRLMETQGRRKPQDAADEAPPAGER